MKVAPFSVFALALAVVLLAAGCGGGGQGYRLPSNPISITSNALPATLSGQTVNYCLPYSGGSGGPYRIDVISGSLPPGVVPNDETVCLEGQALEDGAFQFTLKLTDFGSDPFTTSVMSYEWTIGVGPLVFGTDSVLPSWIFNRFDVVNLVVAGGVPPYSCQVVDDPGVADELLPVGLSIPPDSTAIVGAPSGAKPGSSPFVYTVTVEARDHADDPLFPNPSTVRQQFTITVLVPPLVVTTTSLPNGKCGVAYGSKVDVANGIPPFQFGVAHTYGTKEAAAGEPALAPFLPKGDPKSAYALETAAGPYTGKFPEGLYFVDATGDLAGIPRRSGVFADWIFWVYSTVLPADATQNVWRAFTFSMADSAPPSVVLDASVLTAGSTFSLTPPNSLPEGDINKAYSRQLKCTGGVTADGRYDAPTQSKAAPNGEVAGQYDFSSTVFVGLPTLASMGMSFSPNGLLSGTPTLRSSARQFNVVARDYQLPSGQPNHQATGYCTWSVGPDSVVITEAQVSNDTSGLTISSFRTISNAATNTTYEYNATRVEILEPFQSTPTVRALSDTTDMALTHTNPVSGVSLATMLSNTDVDLMQATVNPTWWAYDAYNLNSRGARALQHADLQRTFTLFGYHGDASNTNTGSLLPSASTENYERDADSCVDLPKAPSVTHDAGNGVYNDGGQLYAFETASHWGVFIVRRDSRIYVPFAMTKSAYTGFGDAVLTSDRAVASAFRRPQITVSPDGRFAAAKVKQTVQNFQETSGVQQIAIWSLTGEKVFPGGATYRLLGTGGSGGSGDGSYFYGSSLTLTNTDLYFLKGNYLGMSQPESIYYYHWVYKVTDVTSSSTAQLLSPNYSSNWTNASSNPLSCWFQRWTPPHSQSLYGGGSSTWGPSEAGNQSFQYMTETDPTTSTSSKSPPDVYGYHHANFAGNSCAPHPFRVSADGKACLIIAGPLNAGQPSTSTFMQRSAFVDYQGAGLKEITGGTRRRFMYPTRLAGAVAGEQAYRLWGWYDGPDTQVEISDDGKAVAAVYNNYSGSSWSTNGQNNYGYGNTYESLWVATATGSSSDPWTGRSEWLPSNRFTTSYNWRFGMLHWNRAGTSLVFWAGVSLYSPPSYSYSYVQGSIQSGSLYQFTPASDTVEGILAWADGGHIDGVRTYTGANSNNYGYSTWYGYQGAIQPIGHFISNDGNFYYVTTMGATQNSGADRMRLIGVNVGASTVNGRTPLRGFAPTWPSNRGFGPGGGYGAGNWLNPNATFSWGAGNIQNAVGQVVSAGASNGAVFFASYQYSSLSYGTNDSTTTFSGGGPTNASPWDDGGSWNAEVYAVDTSVGGGPVQISNLASAGYNTYRYVNYLQPDRYGNNVAYIASNADGSWYNSYVTQERIYAVRNIAFTSTGALAGPATQVAVEGTFGRAGTSMAWDFTGTKLYYAFTTNTSNERNMVLTEAVFGSGTSVTRRTFSGTGGSTARFSVLNSGR